MHALMYAFQCKKIIKERVFNIENYIVKKNKRKKTSVHDTKNEILLEPSKKFPDY